MDIGNGVSGCVIYALLGADDELSVDALHILRDKRTMLVVMLIPVMLMTLFGFAISTEVNNINVAVVASERTDGVRDAVERLSQNEYFTFKGYISQDEVDSYLRSSKVGAVVVFASDYDRRAEQVAQVPRYPAQARATSG